MQSLVIAALCLGLLIATSVAQVSIGPREECAKLNAGDRFQVEGRCEQCTCRNTPEDPTFAECAGCGLAIPPPLTEEQELSGCEYRRGVPSDGYPQCCRIRLQCPTVPVFQRLRVPTKQYIKERFERLFYNH